MLSTLAPLSRAARRGVRLLAAGLAATITSAASSAVWLHSLTFVSAPEFDTIEVIFNGIGDGPEGLEKIEDYVLQGEIEATDSGYTITGAPATPVAGDTILVQFSAPATTQFQSAILLLGGMPVGMMDSQGVIIDLTAPKRGQCLVWLAPPPDAAKKKILDRINAWGQRLANSGAYPTITAHAKDMAKLYVTDTATLLPTLGVYALYYNTAFVANAPNAPRVANYFRYAFLPKKPVMAAINPNEVHVVYSTDGSMASANGLYTFTATADGCGKPLPVPDVVKARFTFVFQKQATSEPVPWLIIQHHSSKDPKGKICRGDVNHDGKIDQLDIDLVNADFANGVVGACTDLNDDGVVNGADLGIVRGLFGPCP